MALVDKVRALVFGIDYPRPINEESPSRSFEVITLQSNKSIECWSIKADSAMGTVILFHGYGGKKSAMLDKADAFLAMGYNIFLVDFMGSGGSEGDQTTIGFYEAEQVKTAFDFVNSKSQLPVYLFGTSMGAVAILKAINDYAIMPNAIILECPFGTMYETICARFRMLGVPTFPMAGLLGFWGGVENNFWAFGHNPDRYAKSVTCPTLLLYGEHDEKVSRKEIDEIFLNLPGEKYLKTYPTAGHENYLNKYHEEWVKDVHDFLSGL
jgi:alpha-beta hydrolase superfamily lysophospholipase